MRPYRESRFRQARRWAAAVGGAVLITGGTLAADPPAKPLIRGLVSMGAFKFMGSGGDPVNTLEPLNAKPGIFGGLVIISTWRQLQLSPRGDIPDNNPVDEALAEVRAYNARNRRKPLAVKLRVFAGFQAPDWALRIGGEPIDTVHNDKKRVVGRFWTPAYRRAWEQFQPKLAAKYDSQPLIHEVSVTSCMSYTAEPFFIPDEPTVKKPLLAAGFKDAQYHDCLTHAIADYAPWKSTRVSISLNPFYGLSIGGLGDPNFTIQVMHACRRALGVRCVFDNHDLDFDTPKSILPLHTEMQRLGPEIQFQTLHTTPPNFEGTIRRGVSLGASSIELWQDYGSFPQVPDATLKRWAAMLEANNALAPADRGRAQRVHEGFRSWRTFGLRSGGREVAVDASCP
jgi:hypothetical protein